MNGTDQYNRGERPVTDGELTRHGEPREVNWIVRGGRVDYDGDGLVSKTVKSGKMVNFRIVSRGELPMQVSCFGELAERVLEMVQKGMRVNVEGRLRQTEQISNGRSVRYSNIVGIEVGLWDRENKVHWLQYQPTEYDNGPVFGVAPLPGEQGATLTKDDLSA